MASDKPPGTRSQLKLIGTAIALLVLILFVALNFGKVQVNLLVGKQDVQLAFALTFSALLGFLLGYFAPRR
jgi:uncharacterized integral membrane protein